MIEPFTILFGLVCYGCILCTGFPLGRAARSVEWDMSPELTYSGINTTDLPSSVSYCAQRFPDNPSPAFSNVQSYDQRIIPQNPWLVLGSTVAFYVLILISIAGLKRLHECCCPPSGKISHTGNKEDGKKPGKRPSGIPNIGNTCFMNAVLQVLCWTPNFRGQLQKAIKRTKHGTNPIRQGENPRTSATNGNYDVNERIDTSLLKLVEKVREGREIERSLPQAILDDVRQLNDRFNGHDQQDSYEFFNTITAGLEDLIQEDYACGKQIDLEKLMNMSPISRLFSGVFFTVFTFGSCNHIETTFQRFTSIPVPILPKTKESDPRNPNQHKGTDGDTSYNRSSDTDHPHPHYQNGRCFSTLEDKCRDQTDLKSGDHTDLVNGLKAYTELQKSSGFDFCRSCKKETGIEDTKTVTICRRMFISLPPILVLQFNRFKIDQYGRLKKINECLSYPEYLDMAPLCSSAFDILDQQTTMYRLYGVVCHAGTNKRGHYTSVVRTTGEHSEENLKKRFLSQEWEDPEKHIRKILSYWEKGQCENKENDQEVKGEIGQCYNEEDDLRVKEKTDAEGMTKEDENSEQDSNPNENIQSDIWYAISDTWVTRCSHDDACKKSDAYMLMYERV